MNASTCERCGKEPCGSFRLDNSGCGDMWCMDSAPRKCHGGSMCRPVTQPVASEPIEPTERIVAAAVRGVDGLTQTLPPPHRHKDLVTLLPSGLYATGEQGFLTSLGRFVDREEAGRIALAASQIRKLHWPPDLYTEDLW